MIRVYNTLSKSKETFEPVAPAQEDDERVSGERDAADSAEAESLVTFLYLDLHLNRLGVPGNTFITCLVQEPLVLVGQLLVGPEKLVPPQHPSDLVRVFIVHDGDLMHGPLGEPTEGAP